MSMRRRKMIMSVLAFSVALTMVACSSSGTADETDTEETAAESEDSEESAYTGTVSAISETSISITTDDGDEMVFTLTNETVFSRGGMGGDFSADGEAPEDAGEAPSGDAGEAPSGDAGDVPEDAGEAPDGDAGEAPEDAGEAPSGDAGEVPENSDDGTADSGDTVTDEAAADGTDTDGAESEADAEASSEDAGNVPEDAGEAPDGDAGEAPEDAGGEAPSSDGSDMAGGVMGGGMEASEVTVSDISVGDTVTIVSADGATADSVTVSGGGDGMMSGEGMGEGGTSEGTSSGVDSYDSVNEYTEDTEVSDTTIESTGTDENAVLVSADGITVELEDVTVIRDSDDSTGGDNSSFYGVGAAALVTDGTLIVEDSVIESDAAGGAGVFAYGDGVAYVSDTSITTVQDTSGGIHVAGGGTLYAWDLTVETGGESSAAIRSDRGSGTMVVDGGTYTSNWTGSPAVYSTADITVHDAVLTANSSEAVCIEGLNTARLFDCDLTGSMQDLETNDCTWTVILYQSMSGDSEVGNSTFEMVGGTLTSANGGIFYTTNTESTFVISDVDITYADDCEFLLKVTGNSNSRGWGTTGSNGAVCTFTAVDQELEGAVIWDSISELDMYLTDGSTLKGYFEDDETNAGDGGDGYAGLYVDSDSTWIVTADSELTSLQCEGTIVDESGGTVTIVGTDGTVYAEGTGDYTITVESYSGTADLSGASSVDSWSDFEVEEP